MALDKIIDSIKLDTALSATADAIRSKTGSNDPIIWNSETGFKASIESMEVGGGGNAESDIEWESIMPATDITFVDGGEYIPFENVYPLILGATYKVKWGNDEYTSVAVQTVFEGMDCIAIGNVGALDGNPDETPFVIGYIPSANGFGIMRMDGTDGTHNVAIYKAKSFGAVIHPLEITKNGKYTVPEGVDGYSPISVNVSSGSADLGGLETATLTFMSEDGTQTLGTRPIIKGDTAGDPVETGLFEEPTKGETRWQKFTYGGWSNEPNATVNAEELSDINDDKTVYCAYKATNQLQEITVTTTDDGNGNFTAVIGNNTDETVGFVSNKKYKVVFNGTVYNNKTVTYQMNLSVSGGTVSTYRGIGNKSLLKSLFGEKISHSSSANTGEPFFIHHNWNWTCTLVTATAGTYTVSAIEV